MKLKVDYHFHPNLSRFDFLADRKCQKWWTAVKSHKINCLLVTDHVYKNPRRAFAKIKQTCPADVIIFPGMEYITKEGIDIIIFSNDEKIYDYPELQKPFFLDYDQTINFVQNHADLFSYVTHPFTLGKTSVLKKLGEEKYFKYVEKLRSVEISNGAFENLVKLLKFFPFNLFSKRWLWWTDRNQSLPKEYYPTHPIMLAVGSDAHLPKDLDLHAEFEVEKFDQREVFSALTSSVRPKIVYDNYDSLDVFSFFHDVCIVIHEYSIKKWIKICG